MVRERIVPPRAHFSTIMLSMRSRKVPDGKVDNPYKHLDTMSMVFIWEYFDEMTRKY